MSTSSLRSYLSNAALSIPPVLYIRDNFYSLYVVDGRSMEPSLRSGDVVLVRKSDVYPAASWRRWTSRASSSIPHRDDDDGEHDDDHGDGYDEDRNALRVLALDASSGRPIGDRWTGRTFLKPPTVHALGSVVVYRAPDASRYPSGEYRIKRVVGLGGQLCRPAAGGGAGRWGGIVRVPPFALWMEGDNNDENDDDDDDDNDDNDDNDEGGGDGGERASTNDGDRGARRRRRRRRSYAPSSSVDSRTYGPVCKNSVIGIAERIVWPPSRWGKIPGVVDPAPRSWWV